jgi:hypothetical protein
MRRVIFVGTIATVVVSVVLALAAPAGATWMQTTTPTITGESSSVLAGVSCASKKACIAVGRVANGSATHLLAERWDGTSWSVLSTPVPSGATLSGLDAVSCASSFHCEAVGSFMDASSTTLPFADVWNGSSWTVQTTPLPPGAVSGVLTGISCMNTNHCTAVGSSTSASASTHSLAEVWAGTTWAIETTPDPSGATASNLNAVACVQVQHCTAVGSFTSAGSQLTLAERLSGTTWTVQSTPNPAGTSATLSGVSCTSGTACTAVGSGFAERFDGATWRLQTIATPHPNTGGAPSLLGVSCAVANRCVAVGIYFRDAVLTMVAEIWDGTRWLLQDTPISSPNDSSLFAAVSCRLADVCMGVGSFHNSFFNRDHTLAESFNIIWQQQDFTTPSGSIAGEVDGVSCPSPKMCAAVGNSETSSDFETFAETWDGSEWTIRPTPNASNSDLSAVSCSSPTACTAVGDFVGGGGLLTLAERWNGTTWTVQSTPNPTGTTRAYFTAVSCPSANSCTAVGAFTNSAGHQVPLAERWNGTTWMMKTAPNPTGATISQLNGVSCTSAASCVAVGNQGPSNPTALAEVWDGSSWTIASPTFIAGLTNAALQGVSCQSATSCTAVGSVFSGAANRRFAIAERWNGTTWTDLGALSPSGSKLNFLESVSCVTEDDCVAVGTTNRAVSNNGATALTESWDGTSWTFHDAVNAGGAGTTNMTSVSCPSSLECVGTGFFTGADNNDTFLAEEYS